MRRVTQQQPVAALTLFYIVGRFAVFGALVGIFFLVGFRGFPGLIAAAFLSIPLSFLVLKPVRVRLAQRMLDRRLEKESVRDDFRSAGPEPTD